MHIVVRLLVIAGILSARLLAAGPLLVRLWAAGRREDLLRAVGVVLSRAAESLGPAAIKIAQVASYRRDLISQPLAAALSRVQDKVNPLPPGALNAELLTAYDDRVDEHFRVLNHEPIGAGSIAVVIRGTTVDGEDVAIKVVRPGVKSRIELDLRVMRWTLALFARHRRWRGIPILETFDLFALSVLTQCDMINEAEIACQLKTTGSTDIIIPRPRLDLTRGNVLVMSYEEPLYKLTDARLGQRTYEAACRILLHELYRMIFISGVVHCDLHPGNVAITRGGKVVLYDTGLATRLSRKDRETFRDLFLAVALNNSTGLAWQIIEGAGECPDTLDYTSLHSDCGALLASRSGQTAGHFLVFGFVTELFDIQRKHGLRSAPGFASAIWALAMFEGLVRDQYPDLDFQGEALTFLVPKMMALSEPTGRHP
ncbi:hypothetical protein GOC94_10150 [Sinorhizobium medicae]|nr:hypothetical protein [Sinorhizobium medicae]